MPEGKPAGDAPRFHSSNKSIPFRLGPCGHFSLRLFLGSCNSHCWGFSLQPNSSLSPSFLLVFSATVNCLIQLQQFSKDWFGPNASFCNLWQISGADWMRNLSFKIIPPSVLLGSTSVNLQRISRSLSRLKDSISSFKECPFYSTYGPKPYVCESVCDCLTV